MTFGCSHAAGRLIWANWRTRWRKKAIPGKETRRCWRALESKKARYRKLWEMCLAAQMTELPEFAEVFRSARRALRDAGIIGK